LGKDNIEKVVLNTELLLNEFVEVVQTDLVSLFEFAVVLSVLLDGIVSQMD